MNNPPNPLLGDQLATASDCSESTSSQPPQALPALSTGHDGTFFCCSGHCVKYWTDCLFCWLQELLRKH